jgi:hypothetical protein
VAHEGRPPATLKSMTATAADSRRDSDSDEPERGLDRQMSRRSCNSRGMKRRGWSTRDMGE